jgi:hypothetical protein
VVVWSKGHGGGGLEVELRTLEVLGFRSEVVLTADWRSPRVGIFKGEFVDTIRKVGMARLHRSRNGGDVVDAITVRCETGFSSKNSMILNGPTIFKRTSVIIVSLV